MPCVSCVRWGSILSCQREVVKIQPGDTVIIDGRHMRVLSRKYGKKHESTNGTRSITVVMEDENRGIYEYRMTII